MLVKVHNCPKNNIVNLIYQTITGIFTQQDGGSLFLEKIVNGNSTGVTFSASELAGIPAGSNSAIRIVAYSDQVISPQAAVNFTFSNQCELQKGSITINNLKNTTSTSLKKSDLQRRIFFVLLNEV